MHICNHWLPVQAWALTPVPNLKYVWGFVLCSFWLVVCNRESMNQLTWQKRSDVYSNMNCVRKWRWYFWVGQLPDENREIWSQCGKLQYNPNTFAGLWGRCKKTICGRKEEGREGGEKKTHAAYPPDTRGSNLGPAAC